MAYLDIVRALAMVGVVLMNATAVVFTAEMTGQREPTTFGSVLDGALNLLMSGKARAMLMVLLGVGVVLAWRSVARRGGRPLVTMLRRYAVLGLLFGIPHMLVFSGDILTVYAVTALVLAPLIPFLLRGAVRRPLWAAAAAFAVAPVFEYLVNPSTDWGLQLLPVPQTLGFFLVGVWLARRPELSPDHTGPNRLAVPMIGIGLAGQVLGLLALFGADLVFPRQMDADGIPVMGADGMPVTAPGADLMMSLSTTLAGLGGALFYLGLVWWLLRRDGVVARSLGGLAPLGRMTLTVYLGSTAVFLLMKPFEGQIPLLGHYAVAVAYFVVVLLVARVWTRRFRLGPVEWVWRSLTHLRPQPMRTSETPAVAEPGAAVSVVEDPGTPGAAGHGTGREGTVVDAPDPADRRGPVG
ncbi:acyltransferase [Nocardiopsis sp. MG754419]|nr:acyltransferase [Nocardiopsis sp. MG754419]